MYVWVGINRSRDSKPVCKDDCYPERTITALTVTNHNSNNSYDY